MKFRAAYESDLKYLNKITIESKKFWGYPDLWIEKWRNDLFIDENQMAKQRIIILEVQSVPVGFCAITENGQIYKILHLWILPNFIGKGYGKQLLNKTIEVHAKTKKDILVLADPNAEGFYKKQGFETFEWVESYPKGRFLPLMKKVRARH